MQFFSHIARESEIIPLAHIIADKLQNSSTSSFVVWLNGEMGAGKTTLVGHILRALGLNSAIPVVSPTYTIMNEYQIGEQWYAHIDFYRALTGFSLDEIGVHDVRSFKGFFIEWPEVPTASESIAPTHILTIDYSGDDARSYTLSSCID